MGSSRCFAGIYDKVPSSARKEPRSKDLGFFVPRRPWTQVQGLLAVNCSSVGSAGKRSTGPFSESASPHLPHSFLTNAVWFHQMAFFIATMRVCKHSTPVSVFALRHENTLFFCSIGGKSGAEEGQQKLGKISTSNHESRRSYIVITGGCRTKQLVRQPLQFSLSRITWLLT